VHDREQEFTEFVHGSWTSLLRIATALTGDVHAAEDLLQSALVGVYTRCRRASIDS
jgi:DNA-directed RNA polymerase specialized sigma24 family protein